MPVNVEYLKVVGNHIYAHGVDGSETAFVNTVGDFFIPRSSDMPAPTPIDPPPPPESGTIQDALVAWMVARIEHFSYSHSSPGKDNPDVSGYGDCSSVVYRAYLDVTGMSIGKWTGEQYYIGNMITMTKPINESLLVPGDLVFFDWGGFTPSYDHVEMYMGSNTIIGHGGGSHPMGPVEKSLSANVALASRIRVQRYVN